MIKEWKTKEKQLDLKISEESANKLDEISHEEGWFSLKKKNNRWKKWRWFVSTSLYKGNYVWYLFTDLSGFNTWKCTLNHWKGSLINSSGCNRISSSYWVISSKILVKRGLTRADLGQWRSRWEDYERRRHACCTRLLPPPLRHRRFFLFSPHPHAERNIYIFLTCLIMYLYNHTEIYLLYFLHAYSRLLQGHSLLI